jgi:hypothetical protein
MADRLNAYPLNSFNQAMLTQQQQQQQQHQSQQAPDHTNPNYPNSDHVRQWRAMQLQAQQRARNGTDMSPSQLNQQVCLLLWLASALSCCRSPRFNPRIPVAMHICRVYAYPTQRRQLEADSASGCTFASFFFFTSPEFESSSRRAR